MTDITHQSTPDKAALDSAVFSFWKAKQAEEAARQARIDCETRIIELIGLKDEGTQTVKTPHYKISTVGTLKRELNVDAEIPLEVLKQITRVKSELDVSALKRLATADPAAYAIAIKAIITKPAKPSVKLEIIQPQQEAA